MRKTDPVSRYASALHVNPVPLRSSAAAMAQAISQNPRLRAPSPEVITASDGTRADEIRPQHPLGSIERLEDETRNAVRVIAQYKLDAMEDDPSMFVPYPSFWIKGQLLNVRNAGADYVITILGEEFDPRYPERALRFSNPAQCQDFISHWYQRENSDPRAR